MADFVHFVGCHAWNIPNGMCYHHGRQHVSTELQSLTGFRYDGK